MLVGLRRKAFEQRDWRSWLNWLFLLAVVLPLGAGAGSPPVNKTQINVFRPGVPSGAPRSGECWTDSSAVSKSGAWRCMVGNEIYDPCFSSGSLIGAVICDANPAKDSAGFVLKLTKPLPGSFSRTPAVSRPWLVKLADGTTCEIETGTTALVAGLEVPYGCSDSQLCSANGCPHMTGLTGNFRRDRVWMADKITFSSSDRALRLIKRRRVAVIAVWN
jgi:hypothetical protein